MQPAIHPRSSEAESSAPVPRPAAPPPQSAEAPPNGHRVDWLTKELGRRPTWEERAARARAAADRLGYGHFPPPPPVPPLSPEEHAARVAETDRISEAIRKEAKGWQFDSTRFIRDMRDGKVDDTPDAYWRPPASDHAGA